MIKNPIRFFTILLIFFTNFLFSQQRNLWSRINDTGINKADFQGKANVGTYKSFALDLESLREDLLNAPKKESAVGKSSKRIVFPDGKGRMVTYLVKEASVMDPKLAKKYPKNRSYMGVSEKDGSKSIRFSINQLGFNAVIRDVDQSIQYIEPLTRDKKKYKLFYRDHLNETNQTLDPRQEKV